jgi:hypothetical protein
MSIEEVPAVDDDFISAAQQNIQHHPRSMAEDEGSSEGDKGEISSAVFGRVTEA